MNAAETLRAAAEQARLVWATGGDAKVHRAVADLLDAEAQWAAERQYPDDSNCLTIARAYLDGA